MLDFLFFVKRRFTILETLFQKYILYYLSYHISCLLTILCEIIIQSSHDTQICQFSPSTFPLLLIITITTNAMITNTIITMILSLVTTILVMTKVTQHIPTITKSNHGGNMSIMEMWDFVAAYSHHEYLK